MAYSFIKSLYYYPASSDYELSYIAPEKKGGKRGITMGAPLTFFALKKPNINWIMKAGLVLLL